MHIDPGANGGDANLYFNLYFNEDPEIQKSYYNVAVGLIAGNVYVFAASQGLAAWFHNCNKPELAAALKLRPEQRVLFAQTVGYPVKG